MWPAHSLYEKERYTYLYWLSLLWGSLKGHNKGVCTHLYFCLCLKLKAVCSLWFLPLQSNIQVLLFSFFLSPVNISLLWQWKTRSPLLIYWPDWSFLMCSIPTPIFAADPSLDGYPSHTAWSQAAYSVCSCAEISSSFLLRSGHSAPYPPMCDAFLPYLGSDTTGQGMPL